MELPVPLGLLDALLDGEGLDVMEELADRELVALGEEDAELEDEAVALRDDDDEGEQEAEDKGESCTFTTAPRISAPVAGGEGESSPGTARCRRGSAAAATVGGSKTTVPRISNPSPR